MAESTIPMTANGALKQLNIWDGVTNIKGFIMSVSSSATYQYTTGFIFSRQGVNAFKINTDYNAIPTVTIEHILGTDTITATVSERTITFELSTTWNDISLLFSTSFAEENYSVSALVT